MRTPRVPQGPVHPGAYVRQHVLPKGMSVTKAAALLGIGRPALSNFLNGKAALSQEMALRLERTFGANRDYLLDLQTQYDRRDEFIRRPVAAGSHAPDVVRIAARDLVHWAGRTDARQELPGLLRRLIHSTGRDLTRVDFPAGDNSERPGPDGILEAETPTPWIPEGTSIWEFGCNQEARRKANDDYKARVRSVSAQERRNATFVFVTPRNWQDKDNWAVAKASRRQWKDVRAYDASNLEQWIEQSAPTQVWFAERIGRPCSGYRSLDRCWSDWASPCNPVLTPALFSTAEGSAERFRRWLNAPATRPFIVAGDSPDEALAFACHLARESNTESDEPSAGALVFDTPEAMRLFVGSNTAPRIAIVHDSRVERELAELYRRCHCMIVRPVNDVETNPDIRLGLPSWKDFSEALGSMGLSEDRVDMLARESGRSPAVLRRRLSTIPAIRVPAWARCAQTARMLLPAALVGAWSNTSPADREVVRRLARSKDDNDVDNGVLELLALPDSPLWSTGKHRGVVSRLDALFGIGRFTTESDLADFFSAAELVLSEADPALDLPEDQRWAAAIHDKVREHSAALRRGVRETLVLLSVHGEMLFRNRGGAELEARVSSLIHRLLHPLTIDKLLSHQDDLPDYAEAAPDTFLRLIEADLRKPKPSLVSLLKPVDSGPFARCLRTGLLWALEGLAWSRLGRVSLILAQLSTIAIDDNWVNKPIGSLQSLYRSWLPRTAASLAERKRSLESLTKRFPDAAWQVCVAQLNTRPQIAFSNHRPRWRDEAPGASQRVTEEQCHEFRRQALKLVLAWPNHDHRTLGDLVELVQDLPDEAQAEIWNLIDTWANAERDEDAKAALRERIRRKAFSRRGRVTGMQGEALARARAAYDRLEPCNAVARHSWLFKDVWIEPSINEIEEERDFEKHALRIRELRVAAMKEIWTDRGFNSVISLLSDCGAPSVVGEALEPCIANTQSRVDFLLQCLSFTDRMQEKAEMCVRGFLWPIDHEVRGCLLAAATVGADTSTIIRLHRCAPFSRHTWRLLDRYDKEVRVRYWREVVPEWNRHDEAELTEIVDRFLEAKRPFAAFHAVHMDLSKLETSRLKRLLFEIAGASDEAEDHYLPEAHRISDALDELDGRSDVTPDELVRLEFMYIRALGHTRHGIPNLERWITEYPLGFVQILALLFKRDDGGQDPEDWYTEENEKRGALAAGAYELLEHIRRIPGTGDKGQIDVHELLQWLGEARRLCTEYGRTEIGDQYLGQFLSRAPAGDDGIRPCLAVCEAIEGVGSPDMRSGFSIGIRAGRGVSTRSPGEGGAQERVLAAKYRNWASRRSPDYPYVGSILEDVAAYYEREAQWHDERAEVDRRLDH